MEKLRLLRKQKGITMLQLAKDIGVGESTISLYETGKRQPDYETLSKLADYFDVTTDYLLGRTDKTDGVVLEGVYFRIAKEAQDLELPPEDIQKIIELYKKYKK